MSQIALQVGRVDHSPPTSFNVQDNPMPRHSISCPFGVKNGKNIYIVSDRSLLESCRCCWMCSQAIHTSVVASCHMKVIFNPVDLATICSFPSPSQTKLSILLDIHDMKVSFVTSLCTVWHFTAEAIKSRDYLTLDHN